MVNVSYGGGCKEHEFFLIATSFMESYPVQVNVVLSHEDHDDPCDAWITEKMVFSLLPLKSAWQEQYNKRSGIIVMNIHGWKEQIKYNFLFSCFLTSTKIQYPFSIVKEKFKL